jgi:TRAP transporter TAXI family solute receptor
MKRIVKVILLLLVVGCFWASALKVEAAPVQRLAFGTASIGGNYYVLGAAIAQIWNKTIPDLEVTAEVTNGSGANVGLVQNGNVQFAMTTEPTAYNGYMGTGWADGVKYDRIRAMAGLMPSALEIFAPKKSGIKTLQEYNGKTITIGPASSGGNIMALDLFPTLGIKPGRKQDLGFSDAIANIIDGLIDCGLDFGSFPHPSRTELVSNIEIQWIELTPEERKLMCEKFPYYYEGIMPPETYKYLPAEGYHTIMSNNILFCERDIDADIVYKLLKSMFDNLDEWRLSSDSIKYVAEKNIETLAVPLHPGAIRYYQEKGFTIPDRLFPPEYKK